MTKPIVLISGAAGFIGYHLSRRLLTENYRVIGVDNLNDYYDVQLKRDRLKQLEHADFDFHRIDLTDRDALVPLFAQNSIETVVHLAAQVGARHSVARPREYIEQNILGFFHVLDACRKNAVRHLFFASSSSVYGLNTPPFTLEQRTDSPLTPYAVTKKTNELLAFSYAHLFHLPCTGLRFFTVYGPWGRPDMSYYSFTKAIAENRPIDLFNSGNMFRDFTYIDDVVESVFRLMERHRARAAAPAPDGPADTAAPFKLYNIGHNDPVPLTRLVSLIEARLGKKARINDLPAQQGDVLGTHADTGALEREIDYKPATSLEQGLGRFVDWYVDYHRP